MTRRLVEIGAAAVAATGEKVIKWLKQTASPASGITDEVLIYFLPGTTAGTVKLVIKAGPGPEITVLDDIRQDAGSQIEILRASKWAVADGSLASPTYSFAADPTTGLYRIGTGILGLAGLLRFIGAANASGFAVQVTGDSNDRIVIKSDKIQLGSGSASPDVLIQRGAADRLDILDSLNIENVVALLNTLTVKSNGGSGLKDRIVLENGAVEPVDLGFRNVQVTIGSIIAGESALLRLTQPSGGTSNLLQVFPPGNNTTPVVMIGPNGPLALRVGGLSGTALYIDVIGDANKRFTIDELGALAWGAGGASALDTALSRAAANILALGSDDALRVGTTAQTGTANRFRMLQAMARVKRAANKAITSGTDTYMDWDQEDFDTDTLHDNATNPTRLAAPIAGKYLIFGTLSYDANTIVEGFIRHQGTTKIAYSRSANATVEKVSISTMYSLAAGEYVEIGINTGLNGNVVAAESHFGMVYLGE